MEPAGLTGALAVAPPRGDAVVQAAAVTAPKGGSVIVATALPEELEALLRLARAAQAVARASPARGPGGAGFWTGSLGGRPVVLAQTGDGPLSAGRTLEDLLAARPAVVVVGAGVAGALSRNLAPGDIIVGDSVRDAAGEAPPPDARWIARALALGARAASLVSVEHVVAIPREKSALIAALPGAATAAVDMESAAWARAASRRGVPYVVLRVILDGVDDELPGFLSACTGRQGGVARGRVAARALLRPSTLPSLLRLRRRVREASGRIAQFLETLLRDGA